VSSGTIIARAGLTVSGLYLASRLLGWLRISVLAATFGAGSDLDAFYAAFRIPDLMFQLVAAGAWSSALIPIVGGLLTKGESARAWRILSTVTNLVLGTLLVLALAFELAAPIIVPIITPGFAEADTARTVELTRVMLLSPILLALGAIATSALNAQNRFGAAALAPVVYNLGLIGGAVFLSPFLGVMGLAVGVVLGSLGHLLVQIRPLYRTGFRWQPIADTSEPLARQALVLMAPRALGLGVTQLVFVVITTLASGLGAGAITAFNFAFTIVLVPLGVIGMPMGVVLFPALVRQLAQGAVAEYVSLLARSLRVLLFVLVPISILGIVLRQQIVVVLLDYGRIDQPSIDGIATTLLYLLLGLPAFSGIAVLARAFYARHDTWTPVVAAILNVAICSGLAIALVGSFGLSGIASALSAAEWAECLLLLAILRRREPALDLGSLVRMLAASSGATVLAALAGVVVLDGLVHLLGPGTAKVAMLVQGAGVTLAFGAVYLLIARVLRLPELETLGALASGLVRRRVRA
jgi:putative peptidoglycan lipid II flippase